MLWTGPYWWQESLPPSPLGNTLSAPTRKPATHDAATEPLESTVTVEIIATDSPAPRNFAEAEDRLANALPGYQRRIPQQNLAGLVEQSLWDGRNCMAEAGTGTGKSLGSLIPAIIWATETGKRVVYSTATKALQEQIANKDLPFLQEHLGIKFEWALLKGRSNYLCRAKAAEADPALASRLLGEANANPTHTGDREHFQTTVTDMQWRNLSATGEECPGKKKCPFGEECFAEFAKARAKTSDVVVVNHALTFADVKVKEVTQGWASMLGDVDAYIFDEAHEIEEIATNAMSDSLRATGLTKMATEVINFADDWGVSNSRDLGTPIMEHVARVWSTLPEMGRRDGKAEPQRLGLAWFVENSEPFMDLMDALYTVADEVGKINVQGEKAEASRARLVERAMNYAGTLARLCTEDDNVLVRWIEEDDKHNIVLKSAPLRVGPWLDKMIWSQATSILVSATLSVGGDFSWVQDRLSLPSPATMNVGTPFDFGKQSVLYTPPSSMPSPKDRQGWGTMTPILTEQILEASGGGGLLLYTSRSAMQAAYRTLAPRLEAKGITCLMQGEHGTNKELAARFTADEHSCLFAMKSFFTGVDFQGNTCRAVIIDKLPFPVPTDVMFAARSAEVERRGGSSFTGMSVPAMTLTLLQGFGRLIRSVEDRGVVAILDSRLNNTSWGRKINANMPPAKRTTDMDEVRRFFA